MRINTNSFHQLENSFFIFDANGRSEIMRLITFFTFSSTTGTKNNQPFAVLSSSFEDMIAHVLLRQTVLCDMR